MLNWLNRVDQWLESGSLGARLVGGVIFAIALVMLIFALVIAAPPGA